VSQVRYMILRADAYAHRQYTEEKRSGTDRRFTGEAISKIQCRGDIENSAHTNNIDKRSGADWRFRGEATLKIQCRTDIENSL
jgi:hypothetical protein